MRHKSDPSDDVRMTFGQFEAHLGRNKKNELLSDGSVGGDKTLRWRFRESWLNRVRVKRVRKEGV